MESPGTPARITNPAGLEIWRGNCFLSRKQLPQPLAVRRVGLKPGHQIPCFNFPLGEMLHPAASRAICFFIRLSSPCAWEPMQFSPGLHAGHAVLHMNGGQALQATWAQGREGPLPSQLESLCSAQPPEQHLSPFQETPQFLLPPHSAGNTRNCPVMLSAIRPGPPSSTFCWSKHLQYRLEQRVSPAVNTSRLLGCNQV